MHLLLTDRLSCPRCGPDFGLVLLAERMEDRRVLKGALGCPNCRDRFPVRGGFGDLRAPPRTELPEPGPRAAAPDPEATFRLAALLGIAEGPGHAALVGPAVAHAAGLAERVEELEVVAVSPLLRDEPERAGVSRVAARPGLPFFGASLRGVVLSGDETEPFLDEAVRVTAPGGRVVVLEGPAGRACVRSRLEAAGLRILMDQDEALVATREGPPGGRVGEGVALPVFPGPPPPPTPETTE